MTEPNTKTAAVDRDRSARAQPRSSYAADETIVEAIDAVLRDRGEAEIGLYGRSMLPSIWPGSVVSVKRCTSAELRRGDVVVARRGAVLIAHRLVAGGPGRWVCQGDTHPAPDPVLEDREILGRISSVHLGPLRFSGPDRLRTLLDWIALRSAPTMRSAKTPILRFARGVYHRGLESRTLTQLRHRVQPFEVDRLRATHLPAMHTALLRRGVRPTHDVVAEWRQLADPHALNRAYVALSTEGRVVGWLVAMSAGDELGIFRLFVTHAYRALGVASELVTHAVHDIGSAARTAGLEEIYADVRKEGGAYGVFARAGFRHAKERRSVSPDHKRIVRSIV